MNDTTPYVVVIGGLNIDIGGQPFAKIVMHDSNPGHVFTSLGGVGRNIAHNMSLLGMNVSFLTAFGDDAHAARVAASCKELNIDISQALRVPGGTTSTYLFINNHEGNMELAIADMDIYAHVTPAFLATRQQFLDDAQLIVVDTNIPRESLEWMTENCSTPIFVDPVSMAKASKLKSILGKFHTIKPNLLEAEFLADIKITDDATLNQALDTLLATGLKRVFISLGEKGVAAADHQTRKILPCIETQPVGMTGCGDAFMAALSWSYFEGADLIETAYAGLAAASLCLESPETINPDLSVRRLKERMTLAA